MLRPKPNRESHLAILIVSNRQADKALHFRASKNLHMGSLTIPFAAYICHQHNTANNKQGGHVTLDRSLESRFMRRSIFVSSCNFFFMETDFLYNLDQWLGIRCCLKVYYFYTTLTNFSTKYLVMSKIYTDVGWIK